jgi:hypothetical protein
MCYDTLREEWASFPAPEVVAWRLMSATQDVLALIDAAVFCLLFSRDGLPQLSQGGWVKLDGRNSLKKG